MTPARRIPLLLCSLGLLGSALRAQCELASLTIASGGFADTMGEELALNGEWAMLGAPRNAVVGAESGSAYVWGRSGAGWVYETRLDPSDPAPHDAFGADLDIDGVRAAIAAAQPGTDNPFGPPVPAGPGAVYVFELTASGWVEDVRLSPASAQPGDRASVVALEGDHLALGAPRHGTQAFESGAVFLFERGPAGWSERAPLLPPDPAPFLRFGEALALAGERLAVGASGDAGTIGAVYLYERSGADWVLDAKLTPGDGAPTDRFGRGLSLAGESLLVSSQWAASGWNFAGAVYAYERGASGWAFTQLLLPNDHQDLMVFGRALDHDGARAVVSARDDDGFGVASGSAYVYELESGLWLERAELHSSDMDAFDEFGSSVALSGAEVLIGAPQDDVSGEQNSGAGWLFALQGGCLFGDAPALSLSAGGSQNLGLEAPAWPGRPFLVLGSLSGSAPGIALDGLVLPLALDAYTLFSLGQPGAPPLSGSPGLLDAQGVGSAAFVLPPGSNPLLAGAVAHHAGVVLDPALGRVVAISNALPLALLP